METPVHIPLNKRKTICARLAYFDSFPASHETDTGVPLEKLETQFLNETELLHSKIAAKGNGKEASLEDYLDGLVDYVRRDGEAFQNQETDYLSYLTRFEQRIQSIRCRTCSPVPGPICCGSQHVDIPIVSEHGLCVSQIRKMFEVVVEATTLYYKTYAKVTSLPAVQLWTDWDPGALNSIPFDYSAGGLVRIKEGRSEVILLLNPEKLDRKTYMALLYILFHECVCHAFQGSVNREGKRDSLGDDDIFAEGWMDWIAFQILAQVTGGMEPAGALRHELPHYLNHFEVGSIFHQLRSMAYVPSYSQAVQNAKGKGAAIQLREAAQGILKSRELAEAALMELSLGLNVLPLTFKERERFVSKIRLYFPRNGRADNAANSILKAYLHHEISPMAVVQKMNILPL